MCDLVCDLMCDLMLQVKDRLLLYGGERDAGVLDDLWSLRGVDGSEQYR